MDAGDVQDDETAKVAEVFSEAKVAEVDPEIFFACFCFPHCDQAPQLRHWSKVEVDVFFDPNPNHQNV